MSDKDADRFWSKVVKADDPDDCWDWEGCADDKGRCRVRWGARKGSTTIQIVSFELHNGKVPRDYRVAVLCKNPRCCNPRHLDLYKHKNVWRPPIEYEGLADPKDPEPTRNQRVMPRADQLNQREISNFWRHVDKKGEEECWLWTGTTSGGYGVIRIKGRAERATRISYVLEHGILPSGRFVCHTCNNPLCVNPKHLYAGTPSDNMKDRWNGATTPREPLPIT